MRAWVTGPDSADYADATRLLRIAGYEASAPADAPADVLGDLRAVLTWVCDGVLNADVVVVLPDYPAHGVELTLADSVGCPVVDLNEALSVEPERLLA